MWFKRKHQTRVDRDMIKGFTLVELVVSMGIIVAMISVVLSNQATYTSSASLNNVADEIYLTLRQAQTYGVGVKEFSPGTAEFGVSYGISFNKTSSGSDDAYIFFGDRGVQNGRYDSGWDCPTGGASECIAKILLTQGIRINEICRVRNNPNNPYQCNNIGRIDITFTRPSTMAQIVFFNSAGNPIEDDPEFIGARIGVLSPQGLTRSVIIYYNGQISVR